ncbi:MAG: PTS sugar transporter subunit IIA, partial [Salinisphaera sp.]|nr:PTS sugar transporter subunit IIA [Salinisphaera sp.]
MHLAEIVCEQQSQVADDISSKKRALESLSEQLAAAAPGVDADDVFTALVNREKLGSTGLGDGVAIPHGRLSGVQSCVGAMLRLVSPGVDFEAPDSKPVDLFFGLLVPEDSTDEHLEILRNLAEMFAD